MIIGNIKYKGIQKFEQQVKVLAPYISEKEKDFLISDFSRMKGHNDFLKVNGKIQRLADSVKVELPRTDPSLF